MARKRRGTGTIAPAAKRRGGFVPMWRQVDDSALYVSLTNGQRGIFWDLIRFANWKAGAHPYAGRWVAVARGEMSYSLETLAEKCKASVKEMRTALRILMADDTEVGGNGPFITERWSGIEPGRGLRVLRIVKYEEFCNVDGFAENVSLSGHSARHKSENSGTAPGTEAGTPANCTTAPVQSSFGALAIDEGTPSGTEAGTTGARVGHGSGTTRAPIEPIEPKEPREPQKLAKTEFGDYVRVEWPDVDAPEAFEMRARAAFPAVDPLVEAKKARGWELADVKQRKVRHGPFFWNWLGRAQQHANRTGGPSPPGHVMAPVSTEADFAEPNPF